MERRPLSSSLAALALVALISVSLAVPQRAHAQLAVIDVAQAAKEHGLDSIAWLVSKTALQSVIKSTVNWINSGFHGSPAFVTDLSNNLQRVGDAAANQFIAQYNSSSAINSPFRDTVGQAAIANYFLSTSRDGFFLQNPYTLNQVSSDDAAFLAGDFSKGGFSAWLSASLYPQNNPIGAYFLAQDALNSTISGQQAQRATELNWGQGFLSWRGDCNYAQNTSTGQITNLALGGSGVDLNSTDKCISYSIQTPGSVIQSQLQKVLGSSVDQLVTADELNEVVGALVGQLINQTLNGGLSSLSQPSAGGGGTYINQAANPAQYSTAVSTTDPTSMFLATLASKQADIQQYQASWQTILNAATAAKAALQGSTCAVNAATTISAQIDPVIAEANTAIANATSVIASLNQIKNSLVTAQASGSTAQTTAVSGATTQFATLLASPQMPSSTDLTNAAAQSIASTDTSKPTLFDQMNTLAAQAACAP